MAANGLNTIFITNFDTNFAVVIFSAAECQKFFKLSPGKTMLSRDRLVGRSTSPTRRKRKSVQTKRAFYKGGLH